MILLECRTRMIVIPNSMVSFAKRQANQVAYSFAMTSRFNARNFEYDTSLIKCANSSCLTSHS